MLSSYSCLEVLEAIAPRLRKDTISLYDILNAGMAQAEGELRPSYTCMLQVQFHFTCLWCVKPSTKSFWIYRMLSIRMPVSWHILKLVLTAVSECRLTKFCWNRWLTGISRNTFWERTFFRILSTVSRFFLIIWLEAQNVLWLAMQLWLLLAG